MPARKWVGTRLRREPTRLLLALAACTLALSARAEVRVAPVFGDHMVLQRDRPVAIWGDASPAETVAVAFADQKATATADKDGHWRTTLAPMPASAESRTLTVTGSNAVTLADVLVGEVWLCSGQSNMEKPLGPRGGQKPTDNFEAEIRNANHPLVRLYQMPQHGKPQKNVLGLTWVVCTPESVQKTDFSAAAYYFGRELQHELGVPVGLIDSSFGGTQIEAWIPASAFDSHPAIRSLRGVPYQAWVKGVQATELYESMIRPWVGYALRGFLWYQGEANAMQADDRIYTEKMRALIDGWREAWGDAQAPWYFVQIAPFDYSRWTSFPQLLTPEELPVFWEAQERALEIPRTGIVATMDLVGNLHDIHPTNKRDVGDRLARLALSDTYGRTDLVARSPMYAGMHRAGNAIAIKFKDVGAGLKTRDGKPPTDFAIAGADGYFVPGTARGEGDTVVVSSPQVPEPVAVRFAWHETAQPNLMNSAGLPALPFRTDDWPVELRRSRPPKDATAAELDDLFRQPPMAAKPWVFWYWMNAAVTKAGITTDLTAMKEQGIGGAYLMPIKGPAEPPWLTPPAVQLTPEWWALVKFAFAEADRLGVTLAMQDCDGFATAGGPWITAEHSMQKVVWTETLVEGGRQVELALPQPETREGFYRDIAVFAVPAEAAAGRTGGAPKVSTSVAGKSAQFLANPDSTEVFQSNTPCWIQFAYEQPFTLRSVTIKLPPAPNDYQPNTYQANRLAIDASDDGEHFRRVARLEPPRHGWQDGGADMTHALPPTTARYFRFSYDPAGAEPGAEDLDSAKWKPVLKLRALVLGREPRVHGFEGKSGAAWRVSPPTSEDQVANADCVPLGRIIALTTKVGADGRLSWEAPPGTWRILRMGHTSTGHRNETGGGGRGLECDKFDPATVRFQFDHWFGEVVRQVGVETARRVLKVFHVDSWECASQNWSPVFHAEFVRRRGYDPLPYLPAFAGVPVESVDTTERFLRDVRTTIAEVLTDNFFGTLAALAHGQGCEFSAESVAPTMVSDGMAHFAQVDLPMGEFWLRSATHDKLNDIFDAVSGARTYGHPVVQAEAFTEINLAWDESPRMLKALQDRNYCFGINRFVYHVFAENPWPERRPGMTLGGVGLFFAPTQTWWKPGRAWVEYAQRCQALLQQGHAVADVAVFTGEEIPRRAVVPWELRSTFPNLIAPLDDVMAGHKTPRIVEAGDWIDPLHGYAYDSINRDVLLRLAKVVDGRLELPGGASYRVLVVPAANKIDPIPSLLTPEVAARLRELAEAGLTIIFGDRPLRSPSLHDAAAADQTVATMASILWSQPVGSGNATAPTNQVDTVGKGRVVHGPYRERDFSSLGVDPDVVPTELNGTRAGGFAWTHRAAKGWDLYFVSNQRDVARDLVLSFRVGGRAPEIWNAVTGDQEPAPNWRSSGERTDVPVHLPGSGSAFVVFRSAPSAPAADGTIYGTEPAVAQTVAGAWTVTFASSSGGPAAPLRFAELAAWTTRSEPGVRNYSGTAVYEKTFVWTAPAAKPRHVWLDLGGVRDIAEVTVNGRACGVAWTDPFRVDVGAAVHAGENSLRIAVTNTWFNRLAGDRGKPAAERLTWTTAPDRTEGKPLLDEGLLGPVTLRVE